MENRVKTKIPQQNKVVGQEVGEWFPSAVGRLLENKIARVEESSRISKLSGEIRKRTSRRKRKGEINRLRLAARKKNIMKEYTL